MALPTDKLRRMRERMARLNLESAQRAAASTPGESIRMALELSELVLRSDSNFDKPLPPSLPALWKAMKRSGR